MLDIREPARAILEVRGGTGCPVREPAPCPAPQLFGEDGEDGGVPLVGAIVFVAGGAAEGQGSDGFRGFERSTGGFQ